MIEAIDTEKTPQKLAAERRAWVNTCTSGQRGADNLTDCERQIIEALRVLNYEVASENRFARLIRRKAA